MSDHVKAGKIRTDGFLQTGKTLKRLVFVWTDLTTIGGITTRTTNILNHSKGRSYEYRGFTAKAVTGQAVDHVVCHELDPDFALGCLEYWNHADTVIFVANNSLRLFPDRIVRKLLKFPLIYIAAAQLAFMVQDSKILKDLDYVDRLRVTRILSFSDGDINFQHQLGIYGQTKVFPPVDQRMENDYSLSKNIELTYVGRLDFRAKDCEKLIELAIFLEKNQLQKKIVIYTTDAENSPSYKVFFSMMANQGLEGFFDIRLNIRDKDLIYNKASFLLLPSRKESFGNAVVEALSYGVPAIVAAYAPGPAEIVENGMSGFVLNEFTPEAVFAVIDGLKPLDRMLMSARAFERHKRYSVEQHLDQLEEIAREVLDEFDGVNRLPVLPRLKIFE